MSDPNPSNDPLIDVFNQAKVRPPGEERRRFVEAACKGDASFCAKVDELLRAHDEAGSFLNANPVASPEMEAEFSRLKPEEQGDSIGHYKLLQQIGEGGFGTVWMAEQSVPVKRRVALKIIKLGMDTKEVVARFEQERQALAMMDHPNIARVFDAGATPTGRPYFVMELVRGIKITEYCDEQQLSMEERMALFIHVCQAVQHAHQKGIIHRDLKPSNILVTINDGEPVPKVIDFGVAKATQGNLSDATLFTKFEQMIGTPLYMSPEQAELTSLDIDTRSDIYSLGVLLYELLTGRTPIDTSTMARAGMDEIRRIIREVDPPKPSARLKTLDGNELTTAAKRRHTDAAHLPKSLLGDIDWIVMKCLEKDRKRRYETANGLAADLQRHLRNEVVIARPPTAAYLLGKLIKRNKLAFSASIAVAVSIIAGMAATAWQLVQTRKAEQRAVSTLDELRKTAPAFAEQARALAAKERFDEAIEKLEYAAQLRPNAAEFVVAKGDLLQCQLKLAEAAVAYRHALRIEPGHSRAEASAKLCDELLAAKPAEQGKLTRESLAKLHVAMQQQQRPAAELMPVARLLGEEKKLILDYWVARLRDLPVSGDNPLEKRLTVREDGRLALDLSDTKVTDLSPLAGAPLATLNASNCQELIDLSPLRGLRLVELNLSATSVSDLSPLREMHSLETLNLNGSGVISLAALSALRPKSLSFAGCAVSDLSPIRKMSLEKVEFNSTRVTDLGWLEGMPIKSIDLSMTPILDFSPLAKFPLEQCYLQRNRITDLSVLRGKPLKELVLWGCSEARNYAVLREIETLELLLLPSEYRTLPAEDYAAIGALRSHPRLRQLGSEIMNRMGYQATGSKDIFWQDWDREQTFLPALRASGIPFTLTKLPTGSYRVVVANGQSFRDLSAFKGAPISELSVTWASVTDLTPLQGLPLRVLNVSGNAVKDLSPLRGMPLEELNLYGNKVSDLSPLIGMPLKRLYLERCANLKDLAVLGKLSTLEHLTVPMAAANLEVLQTLPHLKKLAYNRWQSAPFDPVTTTEQFWKERDENGWIQKLQESGFKPNTVARQPDGTWLVDLLDIPIANLEPLKGVQISELRIGNTAVTDLSPLRGMPLKSLWMHNTMVADLSPLEGMALENIQMSGTRVKDISVLRGMPLGSLRLHACKELTDLSPLADATELKELTIPEGVTNLEFLRALPKLVRLSYTENKDWLPDKTAAMFWKEYDEQPWLHKLRAAGFKPDHAKRLADGTWDLDLRKVPISSVEALRGAALSKLNLGNTAVADLSPLQGMPLKHLVVYNTKVTDLRPLQGMPLEYLHAGDTKVEDIAVLRGMPLQFLWLHNCPLTDISPLAEAKKLTTLTLPGSARNIEFLRDFPNLERLAYSYESSSGKPVTTAAQFWQEYEKSGWLRALEDAGFTPKRVERLQDGTWLVSLLEVPIKDLGILRGAPISVLQLGKTLVTDLSPLRGLPLQRLSIYGTKVSDLRPLQGMPITYLHMAGVPVKDIAPLRGMPLQTLRMHGCREAIDLSPLAGADQLEDLTIPGAAQNIEVLRNLPALERIGYGESDGKGGPPDTTAAQFWAARDGQSRNAR